MSFYKCGHRRAYVFISKKNFVKQMLIYDDWKRTKGFEGDKSQCPQCFYKSRTKEQMKEYDKKVKEFEKWKQSKAVSHR